MLYNIIGAGPAGLGSALELINNGGNSLLIIDRNRIVGGLSRTEEFNGVKFDIGPHRFFTKNAEINKIWHDLLGPDFRSIGRLTRIYYKDKYYHYPIRACEALTKMGPVEAIHAIISYLNSRLEKMETPAKFEDWVIERFGHKIYETFFKTPTEKIWGISCNKIAVDWGDQRIKGLDIKQVIRRALFLRGNKTIKSMVEQFEYPVKGAGQLYEVIADRLTAKGAGLMLGCKGISINRENDVIVSIDVVDSGGNKCQISAKQYFSSLPITQCFELINPRMSGPIGDAMKALYFREHITINLLIEGENPFPDQWIYIHWPDVKMARVSNYNNFSQRMVGKMRKAALSAEYFVFSNERLWGESDANLRSLAIDELVFLKLLKKEAVEETWVVRESGAYPVYYVGFKENYNLVKLGMNNFDNFYAIGRGGLYKYNNQDHSMLSGILVAKNYLKSPGSPYNLWNINTDAEYLETTDGQ